MNSTFSSYCLSLLTLISAVPPKRQDHMPLLLEPSPPLVLCNSSVPPYSFLSFFWVCPWSRCALTLSSEPALVFGQSGCSTCTELLGLSFFAATSHSSKTHLSSTEKCFFFSLHPFLPPFSLSFLFLFCLLRETISI